MQMEMQVLGGLEAATHWMRTGFCGIAYLGGCVFLAAAALAQDPSAAIGRAATFTSFDAPGAAGGTFGLSINATGQITGNFWDAQFVAHGFVRAADGTITIFDPPGSIYTIAYAINPAGTIAGTYRVSTTNHGFLRTADGAITTFDAPGAADAGTQALAVNAAGVIAGFYQSAPDNGYHGFVRPADGTITTFDVPGALSETLATSINTPGDVAGSYNTLTESGKVTVESHGFVRAAGGATTTTFDLPGQPCCVGVYAINTAGIVTGTYTRFDSFPSRLHGFVRTPEGTLTTFDPSSSLSTVPVSINMAGEVTGTYTDGKSVSRSFVRAAHGAITKFQFPGNTIGTSAQSINDSGAVAGYYEDAAGLTHGFLRTP